MADFVAAAGVLLTGICVLVWGVVLGMVIVGSARAIWRMTSR